MSVSEPSNATGRRPGAGSTRRSTLTTPADRFRQVDAIFDEALDLDAIERVAYVERACAGDDGLKAAVLRLLEAHRQSERFLDRPALPFAGSIVKGSEDLLDGITPDPMPERIDQFRIVGLLGRGGMGQVYLGERDDGQFGQRVALKVMQRLSPRLMRRFLDERRILAQLEHPGIARLVDGGVSDEGRPYFAMELVEGEAIDRYCDSHLLDLDARLDLFAAACDAVGYAHQHLVVHRDLKPSNILVAGDGRVKLVDFGIAKALGPADGGSDLTGTGEYLMTPEFAAPEQTRGEPVTTGTDVYALGVLLYLLLSGRHPYELRGLSPAAIERVISEVEPLPPSATFTGPRWAGDAPARARARGSAPERLRRRIHGDLDAIVMKALRKEPGRRYPSVAAFRADLEHFRSGRPVQARPDSPLYRLAKFVGRNRVAVSAGLVATAVLVLAAVFSAVQMHEARRQRDTAVREARQHEAMAEIQTVLAGDMRGADGRPLPANERIFLAERVLTSRYKAEPWLIASVALGLGEQLVSTGDREGSRALLARARAVALGAGLPGDVAVIDCSRAETFAYDDQMDSAASLLAEAAAAMAQVREPSPAMQMSCLLSEGTYNLAAGRPDSAVALQSRAVALSHLLPPGRVRLMPEFRLAEALRGAGRTREASEHQRQILVGLESAGYLGSDELPTMVEQLASTLSELGELAVFDSVVSATMLQVGALRGQQSSGVLNFLHGLALLRLGELDSAEVWFSVARRDTTEGAGGLAWYLPPATTQLLVEQGRIAEARRSLPALPTGTRFRRATGAWLRARILRAEGQRQQAARLLEDTLAVLWGGTPATALSLPFVTAAEWRLEAGDARGADSLATLGRAAAAVDSLALRRSAYAGRAELVRARALVQLGDSAGGRLAAENAVSALAIGYGPTRPLTKAAQALRDSLFR
ncbi:MAG TPA: serine/threonine-protein kinase [Gemmatimonadales bacterium]|nr:serine/threonine-protein kinase [Gemmatimonadales bacterium]